MSDSLTSVDKFFELKGMPHVGWQMLRAVCASRKKAKHNTQALSLGARLEGVELQPSLVRAYNQVCGQEGAEVMLTYPQVLASPLHLFLMTQRAHPFPVLGMVHIGNFIEQHQPLQFETLYTVVVRFGQTRAVARGCEFDVHTEWLLDEEVVWHSTMTILCRIPGLPKPPKPSQQPSPLGAGKSRYIRLAVPSDQGRQYARVSNDYNPIHLSDSFAKLFGFQQAIAHGMWTAAKVLALISQRQEQTFHKMELSFKQPVPLGAFSSLKYLQDPQGTGFELLSGRDSRVQLEGTLWNN